MSNSKDLLAVLWEGSDVLRNKMDANEYKTYLLGLIFYKYLSDSYLMSAYDLLNDAEPSDLNEALKVYKEFLETDEADELLEELQHSLHYTLKPEHTYTSLIQCIQDNCFERSMLQEGFNQVESCDELFEGLFVDVDLYSNRLGTNDTKQSATIAELISVLDKADLVHAEGDVLGNAYEYLIGQFASETGKKAGEFYTPHAVAKLLGMIVLNGQEDKKGLQVYDPCMGSGSLLINLKNYSNYPDYIKYYGQELMPSTYNLARMNMFLHHVAPENQHLRNGDTLDKDWPQDEDTEFEGVVANPPYSASWSASENFKNDPRFVNYGGNLAPKSKADYAFLLHCLHHLSQDGTMGIVLPHGVLFRGASEGKIRKQLLEQGNIYAVIGLASNLFYNTSIPTCIIVLKKHRDSRDVLFIDASKQFVKAKTQNVMEDSHIDHVMNLYKNRTDVDKECHLASFEEIEKNDFNLNIPRYVDTTEPEPEIDLGALTEKMVSTNKEIEECTKNLLSMMDELSGVDLSGLKKVLSND